MLRSMLSFRPEDRPSAQQVLESESMIKWALPKYESIKMLKSNMYGKYLSDDCNRIILMALQKTLVTPRY